MSNVDFSKYLDKLLDTWICFDATTVKGYSRYEFDSMLRNIVGHGWHDYKGYLIDKNIVEHRDEKYILTKEYRKRALKNSDAPIEERPLNDVSAWQDFKKLLDYYIECVKSSDKAEYVLKADKNDIDFIIPEGGFTPGWLQRLGVERRVLDIRFPDSAASLLAKTIFGRKPTEEICVGYPVLARYDSRSGELTSLVPLGVIPVEPLYSSLTTRSSIKLKLKFEEAMINQRWLESVVEYEDFNLLFDTLYSLHKDDQFTGKIDLALSLDFIMSLSKKTKGIDPDKLIQVISTRDKTSRTKIYNTAVIFNAKSTTFVKNLLRELDEIKNTSPYQLDKTSLAYIFRNPPLKNIDLPHYHSVSFVNTNIEQVTATEYALSSRLSRVQGPPGTGKTQVAMNIIYNSILAGRSVLFTSKNHSALQAIVNKKATEDGQIDIINFSDDEDRRTTWWYDVAEEDNRRDLFSQYLSGLDANRVIAFNRAYDEQARFVNAELERSEVDRKIYSKELESARLEDQLKEFLLKSDGKMDASAIDCAHIIALARRAALYNKNSLKGLIFRIFTTKQRYQGTIDELINEAPAFKAILINGEYDKLLESATALERLVRDYNDSRAEIAKLKDKLLAISPTDSEKRDYIAREQILSDEGRGALYQRWANNLADESYINELKDYILDVKKDHLKKDDSSINYSVELLRRFHKREPAWCAPLLSLRKAVPLLPAVFDLCIIDESSQCDPVSVIPALFRARSCVMIGDPKQFSPIFNLSPNRNEIIYKARGIYNTSLKRFDYLMNTGYSLLNGVHTTLLREHFRCAREIAEFSNRTFYSGALMVRTNESNLNYPSWYDGHSHIVWRDVRGDLNTQAREAVAILKELKADKYSGTIGITSPLRAMIDDYVVNNLIEEDLYDKDDRSVVVSTSYAFQGRERDIIIFLTAYCPELSRGKRWYLTDRSNDNIYNVTISRAKALLIVVGDLEACRDTDNCCLSKLARYYDNRDQILKKFDSPLEKKLYDSLLLAGIETIPQYRLGSYFFDLAYIDEAHNIHIDIEVDGKQFHFTEDGERRIRDYKRDYYSETMGWTVMRFIGRAVYSDVDLVVSKIAHEIEHQRAKNGLKVIN